MGSDKDMTDLGVQQSQLRSLIDSSPVTAWFAAESFALLEEESENKQVQSSKTLFVLFLNIYLNISFISGKSIEEKSLHNR